MTTLIPIAQGAIENLRKVIQWKPDKALPHLEKRIAQGHLSKDSTLNDYETIIQNVINNLDAEVYIYVFSGHYYPTIIAPFKKERWLVMTDENGILETAFPPDDSENYLASPNFNYLGRLEEVLL